MMKKEMKKSRLNYLCSAVVLIVSLGFLNAVAVADSKEEASPQPPALTIDRERLWPVERSIEIALPAEKVWAIISTPGYLESVHPFVESNLIKKWPGAGSMDRIIYDNGKTFDRHLYNWIEGEGYDLEIGDVGEEANSHVRWRIVSLDENRSTISITITPYKPFGPRFIYWIAMQVYFEDNMGRYLDSVVQGIRYYAETGKTIEKNQFGTVSGFSG